ncbi:hypothetical protein Q4543_21755 [Salipiger sp. 1_MG-2023]|uniref:hypothetical protein n=1 Tax=Salipiger sp. 1_MG-2023 TaxID=3062665 RepID=UPI0026E1F79C|nr:hypothetical protein [Salipiger sp. 1_MG-2023]MDO6588133.1 hypothetical protein [Salipiger sp. 1_MG-2023]
MLFTDAGIWGLGLGHATSQKYLSGRMIMAQARLKRFGKTFQGAGTNTISALGPQVEDGERLVMLGPSGCGAFMTMRMIVGQKDPSQSVMCIAERRDRLFSSVIQITRVTAPDRCAEWRLRALADAAAADAGSGGRPAFLERPSRVGSHRTVTRYQRDPDRHRTAGIPWAKGQDVCRGDGRAVSANPAPAAEENSLNGWR